MELSVWDKEDMKNDDFVGAGNIIIKPDSYRQKIPLPIQLFYGKKNNEKAGELFIELLYVDEEVEEFTKKELERKQTEIVETSKLMESLKSENETLYQENTRLSEENSLKTNEIEALKDESSKLKSEIASLREQLVKKDNEITNNRQEIDKLFESLTAEKEKSIQLLKDFNDRFLNELGKINADQTRLATENKELLEDVKKEKNKQNQSKQEIDAKTLEIENLKLEIQKLTHEIEREKSNSSEERKKFQEKSDELHKELAINEQIKLILSQEQAKVHDLHTYEKIIIFFFWWIFYK